MSNVIVGNIYSQIIERIIDAARNDFEEAAVDGKVLTDLKEQWQKNLSKLNVAHCPWDPPPQQAQLANPPTLPSNVKAEAPSVPGPAQVPPSQIDGVHIKQEVMSEPSTQNYPAVNGYSGIGQGINPMAAQRAQHLLAQQYGSAASAAIQSNHTPQQLQSRPLTLPGQQQRPTHIQLPGQTQRASQSQQFGQQESLTSAQTDGAGDLKNEWTESLVSMREAGENGRREADNAFRARISQPLYATDTGIFTPISQQPRTAHGARGRSQGQASIPQLDGSDGIDDGIFPKQEEDDEDAINSDLDDDDELENQVEDDGDGPVGETILCTYDKVQRVKNKWKCTLKDGILTTSAREYVFHKANGEFEW